MHPRSHGFRAAALARLILPLALIAIPTAAFAQKECDNKSRTECNDLRQKEDVVHTFYLTNVIDQNGANEILVALRNLLDPSLKIYFVAEQNVIEMRALPSEIAQAKKIIDDLSHPRRSVMLHFTIRTMDGARTVTTEHYDMAAIAGQRTTLKQGRKVPVVTGSYAKDTSTAETQFTYIDVGANLDATLLDTGNGFALKVKVERSSVGEDKPLSGVLEPTIRQSVIEGFAALVPAKATELGRADIDGTTQHIEVSVTADPVP